jgi:drug/metabolite transporter (DMT)-like permease
MSSLKLKIKKSTIMWRVIIFLLSVTLIVYYISMVIAYVTSNESTFGEIKFGRALIPFYYWIKPSPKTPQKPQKKRNNN